MAVVHALMLGHIIEELITLIVVLNPIDAIPIFLTATARLDERDRQRTVFIAVFVAILVLMLFLWFGQYVLEAMHISIPAFQIAGAAVLFLFATQMIFSGQQRATGMPEPSRTVAEIAIFPVAMPAIASPGALLAVVLLTDNNRFSLVEETETAAVTVVVMAVVLVTLLLAARIQRILSTAGIMVVTQVMGLVLAAFSVQQVIDGALEIFGRASR